MIWRRWTLECKSRDFCCLSRVSIFPAGGGNSLIGGSRDIVDCTRWTGNVLKMLSGPLDKAFYAKQEGGEGAGGSLKPPPTANSEVSEMAA